MSSTTLDATRSLAELDLDSICIDPRWTLKVPAAYSMRKKLLPLSKIGSTVVVACLNDHDAIVKKTVERYLNHECCMIRVDADSLQRAIDRVHESFVTREAETSVMPTCSTGDGSDAVKICDELFQAALLRRASDIHLIPSEQSLGVQLRVDGVLEHYCDIAKSNQAMVTSRLKVLAGMDIAEKRAAQDGRITTFYGSAKNRLEVRAATLPTRFGERVTLRLLANASDALSLQSLGMKEQDLRLFKSAMAKPHGLILLTGPTGSGKSTTLYVAIENLIHTCGGNVITIEDPIEYEIQGASQVEVDSADKVNFSKALRSVLRHDPDVVMIGEIRDEETANTAIKAALTGHLVFSTLHTNNSTGVVTRLIDMGIEPFLVAATLRMSVAQRLVRKLCPECRRERIITSEEAWLLRDPQLEGQSTFEQVGCISCAGKGFIGRIGLFELFESNGEVAKLIAANEIESVLTEDARRRGCRNLLDDGIAKILDGTTTVAEVLSTIAVE